MMKELIGANAGSVWKFLDSKKKGASIAEIKKGCKLTVKDTYAALGWLAREGKIAFNELKDDYEVTLIK